MGRLAGVTQSGFSLIELVAVIVLLGIVAAGSSAFISSSVSIYSDTARRSELSQQGRYAVERISRELRDTLPNSVRTGTFGASQCVEFMPVLGASGYINDVAGVSLASLDIIDQQNLPLGDTSASQLYAVIFNGDNNSPADGFNNSIYDGAASTVMEQINLVTDNGDTLTLTFASNHTFLEDSPQRRVYIIDLTTITSFCARENFVERFSGYALTSAQAIPAGVAAVQLASHIRLTDNGSVTVFDYTPGILNRSAVVYLDMRFSDADDRSEWSRFTQEVFLRNVP